jgi:single-stranded-DNA-specific exonuclease
MKWEILDKQKVKDTKSLIEVLLENRGIKTKKEIDEFLNPKNPNKIGLKELKISKTSIQRIVKRLKEAKEKKEKIIVFGDYDCDGVCATAILWETLYKLGYDAMPYIPDRFEEGYGLKKESIQRLLSKEKDLKLIITVDNGIVAYDAISEAKKRGIDVIVVDHHTKGNKKLATPFIIHSTLVCGSTLSWFFSKELGVKNGLDLVTIGTIADQMPLVGINRSLVKHGLEEVTKTKRLGLKSLIKTAGLDSVGVYEIGYIIAPRINAMGRLSHALDSLRLLCTRDIKKAERLSNVLGETNIERQKIVDDVLTKALKFVTEEKILVIEGDYHEGVIGLASGKITEKFYRPSIVFSKGEKISKASARSVFGFNIIEAIKETGLIIEGGGHPMAAGFSIENEKIQEFRSKINEIGKVKLTDEILERKLKIDLELDFKNIDDDLIKELQKFEPTGYGNYQPIFISRKVKIIESKPVGTDGKHLKLKLSQGGVAFDAIWFGFTNHQSPITNHLCDVVYTLETNTWNNKMSIQLKIKDIKTD